ncbi:hypothetical protein HOH45_09520 [bacterium]|jgi:hypothetical protein|nr:hypothetical protein [bacterium]
MKKLIVVLALLFFSPSIFAGYIEKIELENSMTEKAQKAIDGVYGKGRIFVRTKVELAKDSWSIKYTEQSKIKVEKSTAVETTKEKILILPGYPVIKNLSPDTLQQLPYNSRIERTPPKINKITVDLIVDKKFPNSKITKVKQLLGNVLELNPKRGDKVNSERKKFLEGSASPPTQNIIIAGENENLFGISNVLDMITVLLLLVGIGLYGFFASKAAASSAEGSGKNDGNSPNISVNPNIELPKGGGSGGGRMKLTQTAPVKQYFDFVQDDNIEKLIFVLQKDETPIEQVAVVVSFLEAHLGSRLLTEYDLNDQAKIGTMIIDAQLLKRAVLDKIESKIKDSLECLTGGKSIFKDVFDFIPSEVKKQILDVLGKSDPKGYKKFRSNVVIFDDLKFLSDDELKTVFSDANLEMLSKALIGVSKDVHQKIYSNLNPSAKDMVEQYLKLKARTSTKKDIDKAQAYIIDIVLRLESEGLVKLREKIGN